MEIGKVPENILKRSVFKKLTVKRPEVLVHSGVGEDCTAMDVGEHAIVLSTDPITGTADHIGRLAFHITANDIASSGAELVGMMVTIILPENSTEEELKEQGIYPNTIRLSIGTENIDDIIEDLEEAFQAVK